MIGKLRAGLAACCTIFIEKSGMMLVVWNGTLIFG